MLQFLLIFLNHFCFHYLDIPSCTSILSYKLSITVCCILIIRMVSQEYLPKLQITLVCKKYRWVHISTRFIIWKLLRSQQEEVSLSWFTNILWIKCLCYWNLAIIYPSSDQHKLLSFVILLIDWIMMLSLLFMFIFLYV